MATDGYMMRFGAFTFTISTAAFDKLKRTDVWRWVTQERFANDPQEQYVGKGSTVISLTGVIFATFNPGAGIPGSESEAVGTYQLEALRAIGDSAQPQMLVDGRGNVFGKFVLVQLEEEAEAFLSNGAPQKQSFSIALRSYGKQKNNGVLNFKPATLPANPAGVSEPFTALAQTDLPAARIATELNAAGKSVEAATAAGQIATVVQGNYQPGMTVERSQAMSSLLGVKWGLDGDGFATGLNFLATQYASQNWADADVLQSGGLPALGEALNGFGIQDKVQGSEALTVLSALSPTNVPDRNAYLTGLASELKTLPGRAADLKVFNVRSSPDNMEKDQNKRMEGLLTDLGVFRQNMPQGFDALFTPEKYPNLRKALDSEMALLISRNREQIAPAIGAR